VSQLAENENFVYLTHVYIEVFNTDVYQLDC